MYRPTGRDILHCRYSLYTDGCVHEYSVINTCSFVKKRSSAFKSKRKMDEKYVLSVTDWLQFIPFAV